MAALTSLSIDLASLSLGGADSRLSLVKVDVTSSARSRKVGGVTFVAIHGTSDPYHQKFLDFAITM